MREFHEIKKKADKERQLRDKVNISIPPPASVLEEWMADTYSKLTTIDNDLTAVPTINRELESFRRFFELQAAVVRKREAEQAHTRYVTQIEKLRKVTTDLDSTKKTKQNAEESVTDGTELDSNKITRKEIRRMSKEISGIDKRLDVIKSERRKLRKESGRIRSYLKITSQQGKKIRLTDVKNRASTGGALNTNELSALLESGGLTEITENSNKSNDENNSLPKRARGRKKGMRKLGVTRGGPRKGNSATRRE